MKCYVVHMLQLSLVAATAVEQQEGAMRPASSLRDWACTKLGVKGATDSAIGVAVFAAQVRLPKIWRLGRQCLLRPASGGLQSNQGSLFFENSYFLRRTCSLSCRKNVGRQWKYVYNAFACLRKSHILMTLFSESFLSEDVLN